MSRVRGWRRRVPFVPFSFVSECLVRPYLGVTPRAHDNRSIFAADAAPHDIGTPHGATASVLGDDGYPLTLVESKRIGVDAIVYWEAVVASVRIGVAVFVGHDVLAVRQLGHRCHSGAVFVDVILDVGHNLVPMLEVLAGLVYEALAICGVETLVRIVEDDLVVVHPKGELAKDPNQNGQLIIRT